MCLYLLLLHEKTTNPYVDSWSSYTDTNTELMRVKPWGIASP